MGKEAVSGAGADGAVAIEGRQVFAGLPSGDGVSGGKSLWATVGSLC